MLDRYRTADGRRVIVDRAAPVVDAISLLTIDAYGMPAPPAELNELTSETHPTPTGTSATRRP